MRFYITLLLVALTGMAHATCPTFPPNNVWNTRIDSLPVHAMNGGWLNNGGNNAGLYFDPSAGIPFNLTATPASTTMSFAVPGESDPGSYLVGPAIESDGDAHSIDIDTTNCILYEVDGFSAPNTGYSGAIWNLNSNNFRPVAISNPGATSADAAGLPVYAGLVRYDEVVPKCTLNHAIRFTYNQTEGSLWPGSHKTLGVVGQQVSTNPPLGARLRLKQSVDLSSYPPEAQCIGNALKAYGAIVADNGQTWFFQVAPDSRWNVTNLLTLQSIKNNFNGTSSPNLEFIDESCMMVSATSYQANLSRCIVPTAVPTAVPGVYHQSASSLPTPTPIATPIPVPAMPPGFKAAFESFRVYWGI